MKNALIDPKNVSICLSERPEETALLTRFFSKEAA
jgi:hypothetical protein